MTPCEEMDLQLHGLLDGELDAVHAAAVEAHLAGCADCSAKLEGLRELRAKVRGARVAETAPASLTARLDSLAGAPRVIPLTAGRPRRPAPAWWFAGGSITALAASIALFAIIAPAPPGLPGELIEGHIRSLQAQHLVDVQTSDRHVVKPWFNGKIDFAPPVVELADQGYPLAGGRLDYIEGRTVAALVYRRRAHVINLFIWPGRAPAAPSMTHLHGYGLLRWGRAGLTYWAVSDIDSAELVAFQHAFAARVGG
ncbi:MAG TPA: zf-HC2 domain-containing protein [Caulobacteraceae bacterium]